MRFVLGIAVVFIIAFGGYWFVGSRALENGANQWLSERHDQGWLAEGNANVAGFPYRFDLTFTDLDLADPDTGLAWQADYFQVLALSYKPNHVIAVWPREQRLSTPIDSFDIQSENMRASAVFEAGSSLALDRANLIIDALAFTSEKDGPSTMDSVRFALRRLDADTNTYDLGFQADGFTPTAPLLELIDPVASLPKRLTKVHMAATLAFDTPWDRFSVEDARPQPTSIDLREFTALWGDLDLRMAGKLDIDRVGQADGRIVIKATNWREMLELAVNAGTIPQNIAPTIANVMETLAGMSGNKNTLDVPLIFNKGRLSFGPIPLGRAPVFVIR
ncbi:hypothetical protein RB2150_06333 [Rhodobacterales bacterium HTCC2150]|nr:hypothetical protein RB2150_06333 [Rhodobacterales bacterium HTCC2150] [Rhodobacteraceae bacterium HTCC2150]